MSRHAAGPSGLRVDPGPQPRRLRELPFIVVAVTAAAGLVLGFVAPDRFRVATAVLSAAFTLATLLRLVLPEREAGLLVVRSRTVDVLCLGTLAAGLTVLTLVVPPTFCPAQPGAQQGSCPASTSP